LPPPQDRPAIVGAIISGIVLTFAGLAALKLIPKRRHHDD
jgi:hypothetical protein